MMKDPVDMTDDELVLELAETIKAEQKANNEIAGADRVKAELQQRIASKAARKGQLQAELNSRGQGQGQGGPP